MYIAAIIPKIESKNVKIGKFICNQLSHFTPKNAHKQMIITI